MAGLALLAATTSAHAGPATDRLREFFAMINAVLTDPATQSQPLEKVARVKRLVTDIADVRGAAAAALDREWDARTSSERDEFARLFGELLERGLVARLAGTVSPVNGMVMSWRGESRVGDEARVMTIVEARDGRKMHVEYRLTERRGRWLVRDVVVDGVSTIDNYRSQFKRLLRHGSYADLVKQLRAKLREETLMFAQAPSTALHSPTKSAETVTAARPAPLRDVAAPGVVKPTEPPSVRVTTPAVATSTPASVHAPVPTPSPAAVATRETPPAAVATRETPAAARSSAAGARSSTPAVAKIPATTKPAPAVVTSTPSSASNTVMPATHVTPIPKRPRAKKASMVPPAPPAADVISPVGVMEATAHLLPSILLVMLGFGGVSGAVFLRRRASAEPLVLQPLRNGHKRLVLVHPVARVPKVGERRRKRRVVPTPRNPARHVDDAHGA